MGLNTNLWQAHANGVRTLTPALTKPVSCIEQAQAFGQSFSDYRVGSAGAVP